jgi:hypothetical protein
VGSDHESATPQPTGPDQHRLLTDRRIAWLSLLVAFVGTVLLPSYQQIQSEIRQRGVEEQKPTAQIIEPADNEQLHGRGHQVSGDSKNLKNLPIGSTLWLVLQGDKGTFYPFEIQTQPNGGWIVPANVAQFGPTTELRKPLQFKLMVCSADTTAAREFWQNVQIGASGGDPTMSSLPTAGNTNCFHTISLARLD